MRMRQVNIYHYDYFRRIIIPAACDMATTFAPSRMVNPKGGSSQTLIWFNLMFFLALIHNLLIAT